jgi:hypothetical protein
VGIFISCFLCHKLLHTSAIIGVNKSWRVIYKKNVTDFGANKCSENGNEGISREAENFNRYITEFSGSLHIKV